MFRAFSSRVTIINRWVCRWLRLSLAIVHTFDDHLQTHLFNEFVKRYNHDLEQMYAFILPLNSCETKQNYSNEQWCQTSIKIVLDIKQPCSTALALSTRSLSLWPDPHRNNGFTLKKMEKRKLSVKFHSTFGKLSVTKVSFTVVKFA